MIKRVNSLFFVLILLLVLIGCNKNEEDDNLITYENSVFPVEYYKIFNEKQIYLTSFGQSIEIEDVVSILDGFPNLEYIRENFLNINNILDDSLLIFVVGSSIKGLQEIGITVNEEIERAKDILKEKSSKNLTIISFHIGGPQRRGSTSDGLIEVIFSKSDFNIFYSLSDFDSKLSKFSYDNNIKMYSYSSPTSLLSIFKKLYLGDDES